MDLILLNNTTLSKAQKQMLPNHTSMPPNLIQTKKEEPKNNKTEEGLKNMILTNHIEVGSRDNALTT